MYVLIFFVYLDVICFEQSTKYRKVETIRTDGLTKIIEAVYFVQNILFRALVENKFNRISRAFTKHLTLSQTLGTGNSIFKMEWSSEHPKILFW